MSNLRTFLAVSAASAAIAIAAPAGAAVVVGSGDAGTEYTINFIGQDVSALTSVLKLTFDGTTNGGKTYNFKYDLTNTGYASRVTGFGFNTDPNIVSASASGAFNLVAAGQMPGFGTLEVCFKDGGGTNNCGGGGNGGFTDSGSGIFSLTFGSAIGSVTLDDLHTRYQSFDYQGIKSDIGIGTTVPAVPEPATWALMLAGFGAIGWGMRRRKATDGQPRMRVVYN